MMISKKKNVSEKLDCTEINDANQRPEIKCVMYIFWVHNYIKLFQSQMSSDQCPVICHARLDVLVSLNNFS